MEATDDAQLALEAHVIGCAEHALSEVAARLRREFGPILTGNFPWLSISYQGVNCSGPRWYVHINNQSGNGVTLAEAIEDARLVLGRTPTTADIARTLGIEEFA